MPNSTTPSSQSALGYLAAFTLGIICMGAIVFFTRSPIRPPNENPAALAASGATDSPRIHFQRTNDLARLRESLQLPRAPARPLVPVPRPATEQAPFPETTESEAPPPEIPPLQQMEEFQPPHTAAIAVPAAAIRRADAVPNGARVSGRVFLMFKPPAERRLPLDARCAAEFRAQNMPATTRFYVVGRDKGLANVLVMIAAGLPQREWPVPRQPVTLRLRGCVYENPVVGVQAGQPLLVQNFGKVLHNVHNIPMRNREQNKAMLPRSRPLEYVFENPELFMRFKCDVHPWEFAYVSVFDHPFFALTDANGNFTIEGLPPGRYIIEAHHRKAGILRREITVEEFRNTSTDFHFRQAPGEVENI